MFKNIIESLIQSGMTESEIGAVIGASQASINRIRNNRQHPSYALGTALIALRDSKLGEPLQKAAA